MRIPFGFVEALLTTFEGISEESDLCACVRRCDSKPPLACRLLEARATRTVQGSSCADDKVFRIRLGSCVFACATCDSKPPLVIALRREAQDRAKDQGTPLRIFSENSNQALMINTGCVITVK